MIKLSNILKEVMKEDDKEVLSGSTIYDDVIKKELKVEEIPSVKGKYKLGESKKVQGSDLEIFKKLYPLSPPKKGEEVGSAGTKGSGNGELALYWLFKYQGIPAEDSRGVDNPDLIINGYGVEVKSVEKSELQLGRFGHKDYKEIILLLNDIFSIYALSSLIAHKKSRIPTAGNFNQEELEEAIESVIEIHNDENLKKLADTFPTIGNIYKKTNIIFDKLSLKNESDIQTAGGQVLKKLLDTKITRKLLLNSKDKGYIVNVSSNGELTYYEITKEKIDNISPSVAINNIIIKQSFLSIKPEALFK